jgi:hypothetical protein
VAYFGGVARGTAAVSGFLRATKADFHNEAAAFLQWERVFWPNGPVCPHCGSVSGKAYDLAQTRVGLRKGSDCRKQLTVKVGTVFASAHIPLRKALQARNEPSAQAAIAA